MDVANPKLDKELETALIQCKEFGLNPIEVILNAIDQKIRIECFIKDALSPDDNFI
jgi:hypothetical protein